MEPPNANSSIKVNPQTAAASPAPTQPSLRVELAHSWNGGATGVYSPGVLAGEIPFLGFGCGFLDTRNSGSLDLMFANGHVNPYIHEMDQQFTFKQRKSFIAS